MSTSQNDILWWPMLEVAESDGDLTVTLRVPKRLSDRVKALPADDALLVLVPDPFPPVGVFETGETA